jgi:hypothetical protein
VAEGRPSFFSLPAGVPKGRVFSSSAVAINACVSPSGAVPGDSVGGHGVELIHTSGGGGPDGVLHYFFRVPFVKDEVCNVFFFLSEVLYVTCKPTAPE